MSFTINGQFWEPETTTQHAIDMLAFMNAKLQTLGLGQVVASNASAIWLTLLAVGEKEAAQDNVLSQSINSFNIAIADDAQISNLLPVAGTSLIPGAYTTVELLVTAGAGSVVVASGSLLAYGDVNFATTSGITVTASGTGIVNTICDTLGPIVVPVDSLTSFTSTIPNLLTVTNPSGGITGRNTETQNEARSRLILGNDISWNINGTIRALKSISGVTDATMYFNIDTANALVLEGGTIVPPRSSFIVIAGTDTSGDSIATAYFERMTAPTGGDNMQSYTTLAGQVLTCYFQDATTQNIYAKVYIDGSQVYQDGYDDAIVEILQGLTFGIGETVTQEEINVALNGFPYATITGSEVSEDGVTYGRKVVADAISIPYILNIEVIIE